MKLTPETLYPKKDIYEIFIDVTTDFLLFVTGNSDTAEWLLRQVKNHYFAEFQASIDREDSEESDETT